METYHKNSRSAFSMIELILIIVIIGVLSSIAISALVTTREDAKLSKDISNMSICITDAGNRYVATSTDLRSGDSSACDQVQCYDITYASDPSISSGTFKVDTNAARADFCTEINYLGGHLAQTYQFGGIRVQR
ncbi:hypothetical protein ACLHDG_01620 [Sulfurovum sp. CS9]|uniref:hypothetical protein n=1 Tax=Sulfurovum sp. CS9 TaxID=3391146 RepID=UPI0039E92F40